MDLTDILAADPDRAIMLAHVPLLRRAALAALWRLDIKGATVVRTTSEPLIGQMRLTWWHDALTALDTVPTHAEPVLAQIGTIVEAGQVRGADLAAAIVGWEVLLEPMPLPEALLTEFASVRGEGFFLAASQILSASDPRVAAAGRGWALVDLACHIGDAETRTTALALAEAPLAEALAARWPGMLRPLGMLARFADDDRKAGAQPGRGGSPARMLRALRFRLAGR